MDAQQRRLLEAKVIELGEHVVRSTTAAGTGHPSSSLSLAHITAILMYQRMRFDPADPWNPANDRLVLSEHLAAGDAGQQAVSDLAGSTGNGNAHGRFMRGSYGPVEWLVFYKSRIPLLLD